MHGVRPFASADHHRRHSLHDDVSGGGLPTAEAIRRIRAATGIARAAFARTFKLTPRQVANLEAGRADPTLATLARLSLPFGFQVRFINPPATDRSDLPPRATHPLGYDTTDLMACAQQVALDALTGRYGDAVQAEAWAAQRILGPPAPRPRILTDLPSRATDPLGYDTMDLLACAQQMALDALAGRDTDAVQAEMSAAQCVCPASKLWGSAAGN